MSFWRPNSIRFTYSHVKNIFCCCFTPSLPRISPDHTNDIILFDAYLGIESGNYWWAAEAFDGISPTILDSMNVAVRFQGFMSSFHPQKN